LLDDLELELNEYHGEWWSPCPLPFGNHPKGDRNASFSINLDDPDKTGLYNCFVCGGGNIIQLVQALRNCSYEEAEEFVGKYVSGREETFLDDIRFVLDMKKEMIYNRETMAELPKPTEFYTHPWMWEQGFTPEAVRHFWLTYDEEHNAVYFYHWWYGKLVGWQRRNLEPNPKVRWKSSPDFPKRSTLFNYDEARDYEEVYVVEGPKAVVKLWSLGVKNAVATFGASVNPEQMVSLWGFDRVYLWFDNDPAGANATRTATKYLRNVTDVWVIPPVDQDKGDPADLQDSEAVQRYLLNARRQL
jgi:5S rRNA maturation endonuclease (ribonuclease M5)